MTDFSITEKENLLKIRAIFDCKSNNGKILQPKELLRFISDLGLNNQFFLKDINYYFPQLQEGQGVTYPQVIKFLDYILTEPSKFHNIESFKCFDRNGTGQLSTAELLLILKKKLPPREYQSYAQLITSSYGPAIKYMDFFKKSKKQK